MVIVSRLLMICCPLLVKRGNPYLVVVHPAGSLKRVSRILTEWKNDYLYSLNRYKFTYSKRLVKPQMQLIGSGHTDLLPKGMDLLFRRESIHPGPQRDHPVTEEKYFSVEGKHLWNSR